MIELLFVVCLKSAPLDCEERSLLYVETMSPKACLMQAEPELAQWMQTHPKWTISRWKCQSAETSSTDI